MISNFSFLSKYWEDLALLGAGAESHLHSDPNVCIYKLGLFAERLVSELCRFERIAFPEDTIAIIRIHDKKGGEDKACMARRRTQAG